MRVIAGVEEKRSDLGLVRYDKMCNAIEAVTALTNRGTFATRSELSKCIPQARNMQAE
jgi:hypothetical protein